MPAVSDYLDTSALILAWRLGLAPKGITRTHSLAEFYCVLTGPGIVVMREGREVKARLAPAVAAQAAARTFAHMIYQDLKPKEALDNLSLAAEENVQGRNIHDWMHAAAAKKAGCNQIVTTNEKHFKLVTALPLVEPTHFFS